jgi:folate-binding protein YgfZ
MTTYTAFSTGVTGRTVRRDVVTVTGPDALSYLQGQCTQDLEGIAPRESRDAILLSPQGKLEAAVRITSLGPEQLLVDCTAGFGDAVLSRLARFKLRVKVALTLDRWSCVELRGPQAPVVVANAGPTNAAGPENVVIAVAWGELQGVDLLGPHAMLPAGIEEGEDEAFEVARIEVGWPAMGSELDERTIPEEAGLNDRAVSFTKGCYTGQELVARLDARGNNVPRRLRGLVVEAGAPDPVVAGDTIEVDGAEVGVLTSVAWSPARRAAVALGYVRRGVEVPAAARVLLKRAETSREATIKERIGFFAGDVASPKMPVPVTRDE